MRAQRLKVLFLGCALVLVFSISCTSPQDRIFKEGQKKSASGDDAGALEDFDHVLKRSPTSEAALKAAREGARIAIYNLKNFKKAVVYLRHLILNSPDAHEREAVEKQLASIYFENLNDYAQAVSEYTKLLSMNLPFAEKESFKISLARSYFYLGEFSQAESEIDDLLKEKLEAGTRFHALTLKGNVLVSKKKFGAAADIYKQVLRDFPEASKNENVALQLAVCYEENQDFRSAIQVLEKLRSESPTDYLELRIKRLQERLRNQPGARGMRK